MNEATLFKLSYGLYLLGAKGESAPNACIINTAMQISAFPIKVMIAICKENLTHDLIIKNKKFSLSVLDLSTDMDLIARFGFNSGRDKNKFEGFNDYALDCNGAPYLTKQSCAHFSLDVESVIETGTHTLFVGLPADGEIISPYAPLTYEYYHSILKGTSPKNAPTYTETGVEAQTYYQCKVCKYVYDGETSFEELPDDYICPVCKKPKSFFVKHG